MTVERSGDVVRDVAGERTLRRPIVVGGMCVDLKGMPHHVLYPHMSNIGRIERRPGGVAFNIASNLARLGCRPRFISLVGNDAERGYLLAQCVRAGLPIDRVACLEGEATAMYLAVLDEAGDLSVGLAAMDICERLTPTLLSAHADALGASPLVLADANLPAVTQAYLAGFCREHAIPLWVEPTAADKCERLRGALGGITYLSPNREELEALVDRPLATDACLVEASRDLLTRGVSHVFVTLGAGGVLHVSEAGVVIFPSVEVPVTDTTGAGDAFVAGTVWGLVGGLPLDTAVRCGMAASLVALQGYDSAPAHLTADLLREVARHYFSVELEA